MDNGQNNQIPSRQDYFTPGVGLASESENPLEVKENIDLSNFMPEHNISNIGNTALRSPTLPESNNDPSNAELGQIVGLNTPQLIPTRPEAQNVGIEDGPLRKQLEEHFKDGKISPEDISFIKAEENKLSQDGNIDDFYNLWQEARQVANLGDSQNNPRRQF